ncbi:MAG: Penicillin-binding protein 2 [Chlamydiae bacterium]|nr:Penicillin-binding protein 2 [Chlamydiota bacterium]
MNSRDVPHKANLVLHLILVAFLMMILRVWFLTTIKHDEYLEKALRPQRRTVVEPAKRGTIRDRFNIPLAINRVQHNAAVCYDRIREIPMVSWIREGEKKIKVYERRNYIKKLSLMLAKSLDMNPVVIEDLIHSKASIFPNTPFIIKEDIPEELYYRLRLQERVWTGLLMHESSKRHYPQGKVGSAIIGYMGAIDQRHYLEIAHEISELQEFLEMQEEGLPVPLPKGFFSSKEVVKRLTELQERAYTIHAHVGKSGIERKFDEKLRGKFGKQRIEIDAKGRFIRNLPEFTQSISGERIVLTLSSELQSFAEELLIQNEWDRDRHFSRAGKGHETIRSPWIKGGAIVAIIPATGEVVALASYPRFDPNDFILTDRDRKEKIRSIYKWLESPLHIGNLWDGIYPLEKERQDTVQREVVTWDLYLDMILSLKGRVRTGLRRVRSVSEAVHLQHLFLALLKLSGEESPRELIDALYPESPIQHEHESLEEPLAKEVRRELDLVLTPIKDNRDKLLFLDLLRVAVDEDLFSPSLLESTEEISLSSYRQLNQAYATIQSEVKMQVKQLYSKRIFPLWRERSFKAFLKEKRGEEKARKTYPHPYTDYLVEAERRLFGEFWKEHRWKFFDAFIFGKIAAEPELHPFLFHLVLKSKQLVGEVKASRKLLNNHSLELLTTFHCYSELSAPLWGSYRSLKGASLRDLAAAFYPRNGFGYGKSFAYGRATSLGSLFKLVTGCEALRQSYERTQELNPLTIIDEINANIVTKNGIVLGRHLDGTFITRHYKGGRMPRSHASLGELDFRTAIERSSNIYFSLLAAEVIDHPDDLRRAAENFGFGKVTGIDLYGEISGHVPDDLRYNQTGLYAFAIGQHSLVVTPLQTAMMISALGNGGALLKPQIVKLRVDGQSIETVPIELRNNLDLPSRVRTELIEGMRRVVMGERGPVQPYRIRALYEHPKWIPEYKALQNQFIGKTSTAEFVHRSTLDREPNSLICKETWFGALSFKEGESYRFDMPDLCVVIYLKFGDYGKEAAPLAAQIIKRWREIQEQHKIKE